MVRKAFLGLETLLYVFFLYCDIQGGSLTGLSSLLKYAGICLCFLFSLGGRGDRRITLGLLFTVAADYFLLFTDRFLPGVVSFLCVQLCYFLWLERDKRTLFFSLIGKMILSAAVLGTLSALGVEVDVLLAVTLYYFLFLVENTVRGIRSGKKLFAAGMCLFLLCDIQVGIFNMASYVPAFSENSLLYEIAAVGMWACYLPAKVCITLAGQKYRTEIS